MTTAAVGVAMIVGHDALGALAFGVESPSWLLRVLYVGGSFALGEGGWNVVALYLPLPLVREGEGRGAVAVDEISVSA